MKLVKLIEYLKKPNGVDQMLKEESINIDQDYIDIFFEGAVDLETELRFFDTNELPGKIEIEIDGIKYINLFPISLAQELIQDFSQLTEYDTNEKLAKRLLEYYINDA